MPDTDSIQTDLAALNDLIVNCPDFDRLEALLGGFNLFQVLKFEHGEIRHSNVLAWIFAPGESHGLDALFLKKWLMRVIHESSSEVTLPISPVDIDGWKLVDVEVRREWQNIDLLLILNFAGGRHWVVCIENKINSAQHSNQLQRYRSIVEETFPDAAQQLFIFLTKSNEVAEDDHYIAASYTQVHQVLKECLQSRHHAIGNEPKVLLENYQRLLEEKFMDESEIARTAQRIYQQHRRALDVIFEQRPDNLTMTSGKIQKLLADNAKSLGIAMEHSSKHYIRFIPCAWNQSGNTHGSEWADLNRTIIVEMSLGGKRPYLYVMAGGAPDSWIDPIWKRANSAPFRKQNQNRNLPRPHTWCALHKLRAPNVSLDDEDVADTDELAQKIFDWACATYQTPEFQEVISIITAELPALDLAYQSPQT